jgi:hypothetical protein
MAGGGAFWQTGGGVAVGDDAADLGSGAATDGYVLTADGAGGAAWEAVPAGGGAGTTVDDPDTFDAVYGADLGYDVEFDGSGSSLPSGWSWLNQGAATFAERLGAGTLSFPAASGDNIRGLYRALPTESTWQAIAKLSVTTGTPASTATIAGMFLREAASSELTFAEVLFTTTPKYEVIRMNSPTSFNAASTSVTGQALSTFYMRVKRNSATSYDFSISADGIGWYTYASAHNPSAFMTADGLGFGASFNNNIVGALSCHWFRVRP